MSFKVSNREKACYLKLRRDHDYSINTIARAFGRSTSVVYRWLQRNIDHGFLSRIDKRKIPNHMRKVRKMFDERRMLKFLRGWELWILGESDEPP